MSSTKLQRPYLSSIALLLNSGAGSASGKSSPYAWQIDVDKACGYLDLVGEFQRSSAAKDYAYLPYPVSLHIGGGEPFSQIEDLDQLLTCANQNVMTTEVVTTASWASSETSAYKILERFVGKLHLLSIYTTSALLNRFGIRPLETLLNATRETNIDLCVNCGIGPDSPFPRELLELKGLNNDTAVVRLTPLATDSDGSSPPNEENLFLLQEPPRYRRCAELMSFIILPNGEVYPCFRGIGMSQLRLGDLKTQSVEEILQIAVSNVALGKLRTQGPYYLYDACKNSEEHERLYKGYIDACHFHHHALIDPRLAAVVTRTENHLRT